MKDFIPKAIALILSWVANFKTQVTTYGSTLNFSAQQITDMQTSCDNITNAINAATQAKHDYEVKMNQRDSIIADELQKIRGFSNLIKLNNSYTDGIGQAFDILSTPDAPIDSQTFKTTLTLSLGHGYVSVKYIKKGVEGVNIYSRLKGTSDWTFLIRGTHSPYDDHRMLAVAGTPENREYMGIGVVNDVEIGVHSDIASIVFAG